MPKFNLRPLNCGLFLRPRLDLKLYKTWVYGIIKTAKRANSCSCQPFSNQPIQEYRND